MSKRWVCFGLLACGAVACGDDTKSGAGAATLSGTVSSALDGSPVAGAKVRSISGKQATTDQTGRFTVDGVTPGSLTKFQAGDFAPVQKPSWGKGPLAMSMQPYDGTGAVTGASGGAVRGKSETRAMARFAPGALSSTTVELALAAPDPHKGTSMRAISGDFSAVQNGSKGFLSAISPVYVGAPDGKHVEMSAMGQVEVDFPPWLDVDPTQLELFTFNESSASWTATPNVVSRVNNDLGVPVYRAQVTALGWLAVGQFYTDLACIHGCVTDAAGAALVRVEVAATGTDHFSQTLGETNTDGCFQLNVRASSAFHIEARDATGASYGVDAQSGAVGSECANIGRLGPVPPGVGDAAVRDAATMDAAVDASDASPSDASLPSSEYDARVTNTPYGQAVERYIARLVQCGFHGLDGLRRYFYQGYPLIEQGPESTARTSGEIDCLVARPCEEFVGSYCGTSDAGAPLPDGGTPELPECINSVTGYADAFTYACADGTYADVCDGDTECTDGADESAEACVQNEHFTCPSSGQPISYNKYCDGARDCPQGEDETSCFACADGSVTQPWGVCDEIPDCQDGSDELNCTSQYTTATCPDGSSIFERGRDSSQTVTSTP